MFSVNAVWLGFFGGFFVLFLFCILLLFFVVVFYDCFSFSLCITLFVFSSSKYAISIKENSCLLAMITGIFQVYRSNLKNK